VVGREDAEVIIAPFLCWFAGTVVALSYGLTLLIYQISDSRSDFEIDLEAHGRRLEIEAALRELDAEFPAARALPEEAPRSLRPRP
jgi:hypothetical protein